MGLDIKIKGLETEDTYHGGYVKFGIYKLKVVKAFNKTLGEIYEKPYLNPRYVFTDEDIEIWNHLCDDDLDIFLWHSDCDGKLTPKECRKIYSKLKKIEVENLPYSDKWTMNELWLNMFKHCYTHRVNMWFY